MKKIYIWIIIVAMAAACSDPGNQKTDWLIDDSAYKAVAEENNGFVTISNGDRKSVV
jgi:hypothetical protein